MSFGRREDNGHGRDGATPSSPPFLQTRFALQFPLRLLVSLVNFDEKKEGLKIGMAIEAVVVFCKRQIRAILIVGFPLKQERD